MMSARSVITFSSDDEANDDGDAPTVVPHDRRNGNAAAPPSPRRPSQGNRRRGRSGGNRIDDAAPNEVIRRIDLIVLQCIQALDDGHVPVLQGVVVAGTASDEDDDDDDGADNEREAEIEFRDDASDAATMSDGEDERPDRTAGAPPRTANGTTAPSGRRTRDGPLVKRMTLQQCRSYTSLVLVLSYCHQLLLSRRTTTLREVYYAFVTHFKNQAECNSTVIQASRLLGVPRHALGLKASPRGWFCGDVQFVNWQTGDVVLDGRAGNAQGHAVTSEWLEGSRGDDVDDDDEEVEEGRGDAPRRRRRRRPYRLRTCAASCVLVIEKEGVYQRLVEDNLHVRHPCILVTSRGFPDFATRAFVSALQSDLDLPVYGLCDCNPYGVSVLNTFCNGTGRGGSDATFIQWMGLRPSQVEAIRNELPAAVFQAMTPGDVNRLQSIRNDDESSSTSSWLHSSLLSPFEREQRQIELDAMLELGYKVELEALHWLGMEYLTKWVGTMLRRQHGTAAVTSPGALQHGIDHEEAQFESDEETDADDSVEPVDARLLDVI